MKSFFALTANVVASEKNETYNYYRGRVLVDFPILCFKTPFCKKVSSISEKGIFFMRGLLILSFPTFVLPLEQSKH